MDPAVFLNRDPDLAALKILKEIILNNFRQKTIFFLKSTFFLNYKNKMSPKEIFIQLSR